MNKGAIVLMSNYTSSDSKLPKTQSQILAGLLANLGLKYRNQILAVGTTLIVVMQGQRAEAVGLFGAAEAAMICMFQNGSTGGTENALLQALPSVLFTALTIIIFVYFAITGIQVLKAFQGGEELTQVLQQPLIGFIVLLILYIFQNILFGASAIC